MVSQKATIFTLAIYSWLCVNGFDKWHGQFSWLCVNGFDK